VIRRFGKHPVAVAGDSEQEFVEIGIVDCVF
jgi:hypothetical protein